MFTCLHDRKYFIIASAIHFGKTFENISFKCHHTIIEFPIMALMLYQRVIYLILKVYNQN